MITNIVTLAVTLVTNSQSAIIGESNGKALVASQETVIQRTITLEDIVLRSTVTTNLIGFALPKPQPLPSVAFQTNNPIPVNISLNTNSPAFKRRLEREQRMKPRPSTNAPPSKPLTPEDDPRK